MNGEIGRTERPTWSRGDGWVRLRPVIQLGEIPLVDQPLVSSPIQLYIIHQLMKISKLDCLDWGGEVPPPETLFEEPALLEQGKLSRFA